MKPSTTELFLLIVFFTSMAFFSGCNAASVSDAPVAIITPSSAVLLPGQTLQFNATENGATLADAIWLVNGVGGGATATGTITSSGLYTAPTGSSATTAQVSVRDPAHSTLPAPAQVSFFQPDHFTPGTVSASNNPLVANYMFTAPQGASVQVQFGTTKSYGLNTWSQPAPVGGGNVSILVAGMRAGTTYHMQAMIHLPNGNSVLDADQLFITGVLPANLMPNIAVQQTAGAEPGSGVELLCLFDEAAHTPLTAVVVDLAGNVVWYYAIQPNPPFPMKLLPNGHMLVNLFPAGLMNPSLVSPTAPANAIQEIDLAGNVISQVALTDLQQGLAAAGLSFPALHSFHHDVEKLPNGHLIMLFNFNQTATDQPGSPTVLGDALVDWDPAQGPVWTWSTFDHIPFTHAPNGLTDWTHANAVIYSPDDGNLILSMRNQNWIVKINYANGAGDGSILWHLGPGGDFTLPSGQAPIEWNYGQHYPTLPGPNSAGIFPLMFFNNGNGRLVDANNDACGSPGQVACYSSVPVFQLNEYTKTAQVLQEDNLSPVFSDCCGNASFLSNGDLEYDLALSVPGVSTIQEVTPEQPPQLVWQMNITGQLAYRGFRIPSLYPGVEWTQAAIAAANANVTPARKAAAKQ